MNKAIIVGGLGQNPELSYTPSGTAKATLSVATSERWTDKEGEKHEKTEWHRCIAWGRKAEVIAEYFTKGSGIIIEGKIQTRNWEDKDGVKRYTTEIVIANFEFAPGKRDSGSAGNPSAAPASPERDDDIPF
jgi:single-strand DNA-binding protein